MIGIRNPSSAGKKEFEIQYLKSVIHSVESKGPFLWYDPDQDQCSEIIWIMVDQMIRWILVQSGFIGSFDLAWSEWSRITDPDPDHPKERTLESKTLLDYLLIWFFVSGEVYLRTWH